MPSTRLNTFHDKSGKVTVGVFREVSAPNQHNINIGADVPPDMIVVGGGAVATDRPFGALVTASFPNDNLSAWVATSKDHMHAQPHKLTTYAIGLSIQGMSREDLLNAIHVSTDESGTAPHPEATTTLPGGFLLVSGGFRANWTGAGSLGTASFPSTDRSWTARSKDHEVPDPANLRVWAIGLREELPVGTVVATIDSEESGVSPHPSVVADVADGFALTGGGAEVHFNGAGNLLWRLEPATGTANQEFAASSKDHDIPDPSSITAFALGIQII